MKGSPHLCSQLPKQEWSHGDSGPKQNYRAKNQKPDRLVSTIFAGGVQSSCVNAEISSRGSWAGIQHFGEPRSLHGAGAVCREVGLGVAMEVLGRADPRGHFRRDRLPSGQHAENHP